MKQSGIAISRKPVLSMSKDTSSLKQIERAKRMFPTQTISYSLEQVISIVTTDPEVFEKSLNRVTHSRYTRKAPNSKPDQLQIACNIASNLQDPAASRCYFCDTSLSREAYLAGKIHVEHFLPFSKSQGHVSLNVTLACANCNLLKSDLTEEDFRQILHDPNKFFGSHRFSEKRQTQLKDFAEIYLPRLGWREYLDRHKIDPRDRRHYWDNLKRQYRQKWLP